LEYTVEKEAVAMAAGTFWERLDGTTRAVSAIDSSQKEGEYIP
jgi:hypothetical protein